MRFRKEDLQNRRFAYGECLGMAAIERRKAKAFGDKAGERKALERQALLTWAIDVLDRYPMDGDCPCGVQLASTQEEVECAIRLVDPCCVQPACPQPPSRSCPPASTLILPELVAFMDGSTLIVQSLLPDGHGLGRTIRIDTFDTESQDWTPRYVGPDAVLVNPMEFANVDVERVRWIYMQGSCSYGFYENPVPTTSQCVIDAPHVHTIMTTEGLAQMEDYSFLFSGMWYDDESNVHILPFRVLITEDPTAFLVGSPSPFEDLFGFAPNFGPGDIVEFSLLDGYWINGATVVGHLEEGDLVVNEDRSEINPNYTQDGSQANPFLNYSNNWSSPNPTTWPNLWPFQKGPGTFKFVNGDLEDYFPYVSFITSSYGHAYLTVFGGAAAAISTHQVRIETSLDGDTWEFLDTIPMSSLASWYPISFNALTMYVRTTTLYGIGCSRPPEVHSNIPNRPLYSVYILETRPSVFGDFAPVAEVQLVSQDHLPFSVGSPGPQGDLLWGQLANGESYAGLPSFNRIGVPYHLRFTPDLGGPMANRAGTGVGTRSIISPQFPLISFPVSASDPWWNVKGVVMSPPSITGLYSPYLQGGLNGENMTNISFAKDSPPNGIAAIASGYPNSLVDLYKYQRRVPDSLTDWHVPLAGIPNEGGNYEILSAVVTVHQRFCLCVREGVYWTDDAGDTWTASTGYGFGQFWTMLNVNETIVVAVGPEGIYRSEDEGHTWSLVQAGAAGHNFFAHNDSMLALGAWISDDGGVTWTERISPPDALGPNAFSVTRIEKDILVYGSQAIWVSFDRGQTIQRHSQQPPPTNNLLGFHAATVAWMNNF